MRILILTHPRSGGFSLLSWISSEIGLKSYHEPLSDPGVSPDIWNPKLCPDVIIKEHASRFIERGMSIQGVIEGFDKVIFHTRRNLDEASISRAKQLDSGDSHLVYVMNTQWEEDHHRQILEASRELSDSRSLILSQASLCEGAHITTTYCGVYREFTDIPIITKFLGILDPQWLDIIHPKRRLQNGESSLPAPHKRPKFI